MSSDMLKLSRFLFCVLIILVRENISASAFKVLGDTVNEKELSFIVSIGNRLMIDEESNPYGHICAGSLISKQHVLTIASCFSPNIANENYVVYAGKTSKTFDLRQYTAHGIESIENYDTYRNREGSYQDYIFPNNDIAIVKLLTVIEGCDIAIPRVVKLGPTSLPEKTVITAGWGLSLDGSCPLCLLKAYLRVISLDTCIDTIINITNDETNIDARNFFCTVEKSMTTFEESDRGSPIFVRSGTKYVIIGMHQKSFPSASEVVLAQQTHKHVSFYYYPQYIRLTAGIKYSIQQIFYSG